MKKFIRFTAVLALIALLVPSMKAQGWTSDPVHSSLVFQIRHIVTPLVGKFDKFNVALKWDAESVENSSINATVDVTSVNTGNDGRDKHLQSADFFDAANHPTWTFTSTSITEVSKNSYLAIGKLTLRDKTVDYEVPFTFLGAMEMDKGKKAGFEAQFAIERSEFGLGGDMGGGLGDDVKISVFLEMNGK